MKFDEALLSSIIDSSEDAICVTDLNGTITLWNQSAERMFGYTPSEAIGQSIHLIVPPGDRDREDAVLARARTGERIVHYETIRRAKDGRAIDVSLSVSSVAGADGALAGLAHSLRDVTARVQMQRQAQHLAALVASSDDAIASKDLHGIVQTWNAAAERMFGYSAAEMVGRSITTIIPRDRLSEEDEVLRSIRRGVSVEHYETIRQRKDGSLIPISLTVSPIRDAGGRVVGASKIARDLTALRAYATSLERTVRERTADLETANAQLESFAYSVSHDLRAPLRGMQGLSHALLEDYGSHLDERGRDYARRIVSEAALLDRLIQDLLAYSRLTRVDVALETVDSRDVVTAVLRHLREDIGAAHATVDVEPNLPRVKGNRAVLVQVVSNLISNAIKFGGHDPVVHVRAEHDGRLARLWVEDSGIGIDEEHHDRIFRVFERLHSADRYPGTGIGLAIVRKGVERLGGRVGVESEPGHGSRFWIELPDAEAA